MRRIVCIAGMTLILGTAVVMAQPPEGPPHGENDREGQGPAGRDGQEQGGPRHRAPRNTVMEALDTNHDGILSAEEIANASASLKKLDKNGDGKLSDEELHPFGPPREGRGPGHRGGEAGGPGQAGRGGEGGPGGPEGPGGDRGGPGGREQADRGPDGPGDGGPGGAGGGPGQPGGPGGRGGARGRRGGPGGGPSVEGMVSHAMSFDADGDGKLSRAELTKFAKEFVKRAPRGRGQGRGGRGGPGGQGGPGGGPGGPGGDGGPGGPPGEEGSGRPQRPDRPASE